jgi:hypothetical protein
MVRVYPERRKFTIAKLPEEQRLTAPDHRADIPITTSIQIRFPSSRITVKIVMSGQCDPTTAPGRDAANA